MGLFDKKVCDICGEKIGLLGNRKLDDGNLCKDCAKKLSPWFEERRHSTVEDIKKQLAYREQNKEAVRNFRVTRDLKADNNYHVFIDDNHQKFAIGTKMDVETNPDILDLSQVTSCRMDVEQDRTEEQYRDQNGEMRDYVPPRYKYSYKYKMMIGINSPWFDDMDFRLNTFSISSDNRGELMEVEQTAYQIIAALTPNAAGMQPGMPGMNMNGGMQPGMPGMNMNGGMQPGMSGMNMNGGMQQTGMSETNMTGGMQQNNSSWKCQCGAENTGKFCEYCGQPRPF